MDSIYSGLSIYDESVDALIPYANNAKVHTESQIKQIANSILEFGFNDPIAVWENEDGGLEIIEGHGRLLAAKRIGMAEVPVIRLDHLTDEQRRQYTHIHNQLTMNTDFDMAVLEDELKELDSINWSDFGFDLEVATEEVERKSGFDFDGEHGTLSDRFVVPPFSILDAKQGAWRKRKEYWNGRIEDNAKRGDAELFKDPFFKNFSSAKNSMLDPVLAEAMLCWFTPHDGSNVFDCFAGDTAFGFVACAKGHRFTGIELRQEQCDENIARCEADGLHPTYICDDGRNVLDHIPEGSQDFLFSCPPYYNVEVYSDMENDASNQEDFDSFYNILDTAFSNSIKCLADNRFAVVVCSDIRDKNGAYYDFVERVRGTFEANGMVMYNHLILADALGSAAFRANRYMRTRKMVRVHQDVLVFYKGDPAAIKEIFPELKEDYEGEDME